MVRFALIFATLVFSHAVFAGGISDFFDRLEGKWVLDSGVILNHDHEGNTTRLNITELSSVVEKTSEREWKFTEHYCVESDCIDTSYFYVLENEEDLILVTEEGRTELVTFQSGSANLRFILQNGSSYSVTDCNVRDDGLMTQDGFTINSDLTQSEVFLLLKKSE